MIVVEPSFEILTPINGDAMLQLIERCGRVCYKSEDKITADSARTFVAGIMKSGHASVIEHASVTVKFTCDRGVSHEIVRHRIASYSQESTRYCNYCKDKFGNQITVIRPCYDITDKKFLAWHAAMTAAEAYYFELVSQGSKPQDARSVLPNSLKTEIVMTANLREWRHFFTLRAAPTAHPQMRQLALPTLKAFKERIPVVFDDIPTPTDFAYPLAEEIL